MVIIVMAYKCFEDKYLLSPKCIEKFNNSHPFDFNIADAAQWYSYLRRKGYPVVTSKGTPIAYRVYTWGGIKGVSPKDNCVSLFPGHDADGKKLTVGVHGRLDKAEQYWLGRLKK
jgi:hypothetical protein